MRSFRAGKKPARGLAHVPVGIHGPDAARADACADAATDTAGRIRNVFKSAASGFFTVNGLLRAGFEAHLAVAAGAAAHAAGEFILRRGQITVMALGKIGRVQTRGRHELFLFRRVGFAAHKGIRGKGGITARANGMHQQAGLDNVAHRKNAIHDAEVGLGHDPFAELFQTFRQI